MEVAMLVRTLTAARRVVLFFILAIISQNAAQSSQPQVQFGDLRYCGAFKLPEYWEPVCDDQCTFHYAHGAVAFNPHQGGNNANPPSLFVACFTGQGASNVGEVSIPEPVISNTGNINDLPTATSLQRCANAEAGASATLSFGEGGISGILIAGSKMYFTCYNSYPAGGCQSLSHFVKNSLDLSAADATGAFLVTNNAGGTCFINGPMTWIPQEWQAALENMPAITYNCCHSIIASTSWGPAAFAFDPSALGNTPAASVALQYYTSSHPALGQWDGGSGPLVFETAWNNSWNDAPVPGYRGLVIPDGTRSALYFGAQGIGEYCYGEGTSDSSLHGQPYGGTIYCYDPAAVVSKGDHAYPYRFQIMAFDLNDWASVAAGAKEPYEVTPYAVWPLAPPVIPFTNGITDAGGGGAAYDPATRRIYWEQARAYGSGLPIIHVWEVTSATAVAPWHALENQTDIITAYPNPCNPGVKITVHWQWTVDSRDAIIEIYSVRGALVQKLRAARNTADQRAGIAWDASSQPSGIYVIKAVIGNTRGSKTIVLTK